MSENPSPYAHWMLREIYEQPESLAATLDRYVDAGSFRAEPCAPIVEWLSRVGTRIVIAASGSSRHAGLVAELLIEELSGIPVDVEYASEYSYRPDDAGDDASVLVISQSGETADTLAALRRANAAGLETLAITNVQGSTMDREARVSFPTIAGVERAIPATKSFTAQILNLYLLALMGASVRGRLDDAGLRLRLNEVAALPAHLAAQLGPWERAVKRIVDRNRTAKSFMFLGRGIHFAMAREAALKLKESAYVNAEAYPSGELKHGPNAMVGEGTPLIMLATVDSSDPDSVQRYDKVVRLMRDMRAQGATIVALANCGDAMVAELAAETIFIEEAREPLMAIAEVVPLQMFSYWVAIQNGVDVDHPRNLTKAVLTE